MFDVNHKTVKEAIVDIDVASAQKQKTKLQ